MRDLSEDTSRFFMKAPGYKTLRVLLCDTAILVEGDADELVVQRAYMDASDEKNFQFRMVSMSFPSEQASFDSLKLQR